MRHSRIAMTLAALVLALLGAPGLTVAAVTPTIEVSAHRPDHGTATPYVQTGTLVHLDVLVHHAGQPVTGSVLLVFFHGAGCSGLSHTGDAVPLVDGRVDGPRPYGFSEPNAGSFMARYLGEGTWAPANSACIDVIWKAPLTTMKTTLHRASHGLIDGEVEIGIGTHLKVALAGDFGSGPGTLRAYTYTGNTCSGSGNLRLTAALGAGETWDGNDVSVAFGTPGTYAWLATFSDSAIYLNRSACFAFRVKARPTVTADFVDANGNAISSIQAGEQFRIRAKLGGSFGVPTGYGAARSYGSDPCDNAPDESSQLAFVDGVATSDLHTASTPGLRYFQVRYNGSTTYFDASSACVGLMVTAVTTSPTTPPPTAPSATTPPSTLPSAGASIPVGPTAAPGQTDASVATLTPTHSVGPVDAQRTLDPSPPLEPQSSDGPTFAPGQPAPSGAPAEPTTASGTTGSASTGNPTGLDGLLLVLGAVLVAVLAGIGGAWLASRRQAPKATRPPPVT